MGSDKRVLSAAGVTKDYAVGQRTVRALRGIDLSIQRGSFVFIMGPSGSGKSTLLSILGALDRPTSGNVSLEGRELSWLPDADLARIRRDKIGFVFQAYNLLANLSALDNLLVPFLPRGIRREDRRKAIETLEAVGLAERMDHRPSQLSGGEHQRVAIARALVKDAQIVLADEPTGDLDSQTGEEVYRLMRQANREQGRTFVVVTHDRRYLEERDIVHSLRDGLLVSVDNQV